MAENAPLTTAHTHARQAAVEVQQLHWPQAADEHQHASNDFAKAARATSDAEALRVLRLLEEQHRRLARIIKSRDEPQQIEHASEDGKAGLQQLDTKDANQSSAETAMSPSKTSTAATRAGTGSKSQTRESSPSLARDIASRRGIPLPGRTPPSAAAQARARQVSPESLRTARVAGASKIPPSILDSQSNLRQSRRAAKAEEDEGFAKFYSNLTSGTMSKLSSVLAYAGLPLTHEDIIPEQPAKQRRTVSAGNEPDVKKFFSKAALNAIEDGHRQRGTLGHGFGPAESFYVVQKGGGTYSYADIARTQQNPLSSIDEKKERRNDEDDDDDEEDVTFVDAKEIPGPPSPKHSRVPSLQSRTSFGNPRTLEELELENTTLKHTLEQLAHRLANFEAHAQDASMAALTQSMVTLRPQKGAEGSSDAGDATVVQERLVLLERQLEQQEEEKQKLEGVAARQERMLKKYQSKWEELKKGAKEKDRVKREKGGDGVATAVGEGPEKG